MQGSGSQVTWPALYPVPSGAGVPRSQMCLEPVCTGAAERLSVGSQVHTRLSPAALEAPDLGYQGQQAASTPYSVAPHVYKPGHYLNSGLVHTQQSLSKAS